METTTRTRAPGAGRKPLQPSGANRITITLTAADLDTLRMIDADNLSAAIRFLIAIARADLAGQPLAMEGHVSRAA